WPLPQNKLLQLHKLVDEQLQAGHIVPTTSPWNTPVFVIQKKNNSWRLLHDLRKINEVIEDMGALQPGLPSPAMLPQTWTLIVIDLKDCFFTIPLAPQDAPRFAFSVPSINAMEPHSRYHWRVLPQGMKNSPTLCQQFVAAVLSPIRKYFDNVLIYHYMDDILIAAEQKETAEEALHQITRAASAAGLRIAEDKVQESPPWRYLGWRISDHQIRPQSLTLKTDIRTLNDLQKLLGTINWIRPSLGISTEELHPLFKLL
ncbi:hypothetical protein N309_12571, partial [Tinamus guttatus]